MELVLQKELAGFVEWLKTEHSYELDDVIYLLGNPHKYKDEYAAYLDDPLHGPPRGRWHSS